MARSDAYYFWGCICCCVAIVSALVFVVPFVVTTISDTERGVVYSRLFARFDEAILETGGIHSKSYNAQVIRWPRTEETVEFISSPDPENPNELQMIVCNSKDGLLIDLQVSFQFFADPDELLALTKEYKTYENWKILLVSQAESTIRNVCGDFTADDFQTNRGLVALTIETNVRDDADRRYSAVISKLQLVEIDRPAEYEQAVRDKENARSEIRLADNEESQALTKASSQIDIAQQEKIRLLDSANTTAAIKLEQGLNQREGIVDRFQQLANVYSTVKIAKGLSVKGILTYISNEVFMDDVTIAVDTPAQITFRDEL